MNAITSAYEVCQCELVKVLDDIKGMGGNTTGSLHNSRMRTKEGFNLIRLLCNQLAAYLQVSHKCGH